MKAGTSMVSKSFLKSFDKFICNNSRNITSRPQILTFKRNKSIFSDAISMATKLVTPAIMLKNPNSIVSNEMSNLAKHVMDLISSGHPILNRVTSYYFEAEGKKIRPLIVLLMSKGLSKIPIEKRNPLRLDSADIPDDPVYSKLPENLTHKNSGNKSILLENPISSFSPLHILHGIKPVNPLTRGPEPLPQSSFDVENGILPKQRRLAEIVEMIHTASLLHDDVIDHSDTRRGKDSGNKAFTNKMAVLAGDFLLGRATVSISRLRNPEVVELMSNSIANLVEGEFMQLKNTSVDKNLTTINYGDVSKNIPPESKNLQNKVHDYRVSINPSEKVSHEEVIDTAFDYYLHKTYLKTASLISMACRSAAILSGVDKKVVDECFEFGKNIGICFQLVDDMLDFTVSKKALGKPSGADLSLGIATAPVLYAWKEDKSLGPLILRNFSEKSDVQVAVEAVKKYNGVEQTRKLAEKYRDMALSNLRTALPNSDSRAALEFLTNSILSRKK
ncbi:hypothetical protein TPHA_0A04460 [Tetrapisispora phaffii CBS 4417]|uniref:Hexaprenyl pyrophosphate synthase, mitochondrial n=1 Tax=Tetrapisispora phaffii (strain ATCC 24235 / CBS 4417 / NBRC 1672 / NRRL Y-8282 / UCD 70-5) TaxID=1071381 RepID=G8BNP1_TETPH|nr:hypothetical protein TPHA_0A04460 [Tetrapisispora phaffii CBS 4417]CCE61519.1 hypothetical protein TPHA_0A04460 [Tetrapisispora phaffii CBS 4417]